MTFIILFAAVLAVSAGYLFYKLKNRPEVDNNLPSEDNSLLLEDVDSYPKPNKEERAAILLEDLDNKLAQEEVEDKPKKKTTKPKTMAAKKSSKKTN
jgi:hypothetical protein